MLSSSILSTAGYLFCPDSGRSYSLKHPSPGTRSLWGLTRADMCIIPVQTDTNNKITMVLRNLAITDLMDSIKTRLSASLGPGFLPCRQYLQASQVSWSPYLVIPRSSSLVGTSS